MTEVLLQPLVRAEVLAAIPQQPQQQAAALDQLAALIPVTNRLGLYDAADALRIFCCR
jgi:hypothetical protein